ncbi:hypothetical protein FGO68_gene1475 [Halteria grandinella]|uniref:Uncharacterized protein n=1 Tax=Halteria grandinella TaxID=5974 RepID=A0A8J8SX77_HALGN|nr:hypothetical protein FGO68_gene1475 [Halteria grandinella]
MCSKFRCHGLQSTVALIIPNYMTSPLYGSITIMHSQELTVLATTTLLPHLLSFTPEKRSPEPPTEAAIVGNTLLHKYAQLAPLQATTIGLSKVPGLPARF